MQTIFSELPCLNLEFDSKSIIVLRNYIFQLTSYCKMY